MPNLYMFLSRRFTVFLLICLGLGLGIACEKDDICVDGDTPLLVIEFRNVLDTALSKNVPQLRAIGVGKTDSVSTFTDRSNVNKISLPLQATGSNTQFALIRNSADDDQGVETGNIDTLNLGYIIQEVFVSRACGFVANYHEFSALVQPDTDNWIQEVVVVDTVINNSAETHVKIIH